MNDSATSLLERNIGLSSQTGVYEPSGKQVLGVRNLPNDIVSLDVTLLDENEGVDSPHFRPQRVSPSRGSDYGIRPVDIWECVVLDVLDSEEVRCSMLDILKKESLEKEYMTVSKYEFPENVNIEPGVMFYYKVCVEEKPNRPIKNIASIEMKRVPKWTKERIEDIDKIVNDEYGWLLEK